MPILQRAVSFYPLLQFFLPSPVSINNPTLILRIVFNYTMPIERKLAAIMFTDIAGYTEQMPKDEALAISLLNKKESLLKLLIAKHNGTYVKSTTLFSANL